MHFGLVMECDYREGSTQEEAFRQAFEMADLAEKWGLDGIWLAERHFAAPKGPDDTATVAIPSIVSAPMVLASALAARTTRLRVGIAVNVLPLNHPVRMAEEAATVDARSIKPVTAALSLPGLSLIQGVQTLTHGFCDSQRK